MEGKNHNTILMGEEPVISPLGNKPNEDVHNTLTKLGATYNLRQWSHPIFGDVECHLYLGTKPYHKVITPEMRDEERPIEAEPRFFESPGGGCWSHHHFLEEAMKEYDKGTPRGGAHHWSPSAHVYSDGLNYYLLYV